MIRVGGNGLAPDGATQEGEPGWGTGRVSRAGLFSRSAAVLGALGGIAVGATELAAASDSQRTPAHDREIFGLALLIARLQAAFYADAPRRRPPDRGGAPVRQRGRRTGKGAT